MHAYTTIGHQERLWLITSIGFLFASGLVLAVVYVCKGDNNNRNNNSNGLENSNNNSLNFSFEDKKVNELSNDNSQSVNNNNMFTLNQSKELNQQQTEMYSMDEQPHPTVYHNSIHDDSTINQPLIVSKESSSTITNGAVREPYDFLIIEPADPFTVSTTCDSNADCNQTILLVNQNANDNMQHLSYNPRDNDSATVYSDQGYLIEATKQMQSNFFVDSNQGQHNQLNLLPNNNAIFRQTCQGLGSKNCHQNVNASIIKGASSNITRYDRSSNRRGNTSLDESPIEFMTISPAGGVHSNGFELNSQGELTMTDESTSFINEDGPCSHRYHSSDVNANNFLETSFRNESNQCNNYLNQISGFFDRNKQPITMFDQQQHQHQNNNSPSCSSQQTTTTLEERSSETISHKRNERVRFLDDL